MKANEIQEKPKVTQDSHEGGESQIGQLKAAVDMPPAEGPDTAQLRQLQAAANASPQVHQLRVLQAAASNSPQVRQAAQLRQQAGSFSGPAMQLRKNGTGMPDELKTGIESLSGMSMDDVRVHYNSTEPAGLGAHAFAQGNDIHLASGQEKHLPHEAWHVVQQRQGRVKPTTQAGGQAVNDDPALESEADTMGAKAMQTKADPGKELEEGTAAMASAQLVAQLLTTGSSRATLVNKQTARDELDEINAADDVNAAMEAIEAFAPGTLDRYKDEYGDYLDGKGAGDDFQWPLTYLRGRASRRNGRLSEATAIHSVYGGGVQKNNQAYDVTFDDHDMQETVTVIPDICTDDEVGDVKNVQTQSFTEQLRAIYAMANNEDNDGGAVTITRAGSDVEIDHADRDFDLIVRGPQDSDFATDVSGPLQNATDNIYYNIQDI